MTGEPSSITVYGTDFLAQFGRVLSSQEKWAIRHSHLVASPPLWCWFYGTGGEKVRGLDELREQTIPVKTETISTVCSTKRHAHTWHRGRLDFVEYLKNQLPELAVFGRGYQPVADKATALDSFRYHVVCENAVSLNHWTEKLADAYLGYCLPFYFGCPNVADYFPPESFIPINIADHQSALETVRRAIANNEYERRLPYIQEARCRVLDQYNIFPAIVREIHKPAHGTAYKPRGATIYSRHALRRRPLPALRLAWEKAQRKLFIQLPSAKKV